MFFEKQVNFNKTIIIKGFITAILLSAFIYLSHFDINYKIINSIFALLAIYMLLTIPKNSLIVTGFFTGIFWFYWIGISFIYYDLSILIPFVVLGFGLVYAFLFFLLAFIDKPTFRAFAIFATMFIEPFGFNWFKIQALFVDTYFQITYLAIALLLFSMFILTRQRWHKLLFIIPLAFAIEYKNNTEIQEPNLKIYMADLNISQDKKWDKNNRLMVIDKNVDEINKAIDEGFDLVVLPETTFPLLLNKDQYIMDFLKDKSYKIDIIFGSMFEKDRAYYNSTYFLSKGGVQVANKVVLVPFGEEVPFPKFIRDFINNTFYNGAKDYSKASKATDFSIQGTKFRNAICYEATSDKIFENLGDTKYMLAISNNAWFTPSIEPALQKKLLTYYAKKYGVKIYHTINKSENYIINP